MRRRLFWWGCLLLVMVLGTRIGVEGASGKKGLAKKQVLTFNLATEPEILDPARSTGIPEYQVQLTCFEGLARRGANDIPVPGVAAKWTVTPDGKTYTFFLRNNAKWSNGEPVTARDFEYSWKRVLNPKTASEYAANLYVLLNAEAYNTGKLKDASKVGVKAKGLNILVVTLKAPCSYFPALTTHHSFFPTNQKVVEANPQNWSNAPKTLVGNGPFKLSKWVHHEKLVFVPNSTYWNRKRVKLTKLIYYTVEEQSTALTMFETGQVDFVRDLPQAEMPRLRKKEIVKYNPILGTYFYRFNTKKAPFNDVRVRKALSLAINREQITRFVTKGGQKPALAMVPYGLSDVTAKRLFRRAGGNFFKDGDLVQAKKLLAAAGYTNLKKFPTVEILYNTSESHKQIAEAIQEMWSKRLGIKVTLTNQEWKVYLSSMDKGNYQIARAGWIADYADPMTFLDMWMSDNLNNDTGWSNPRYDKLITKAQMAGNIATRFKLMHKAEKILMREMPIAPIYFYSRPYLCKNYVKGYLYSALESVDFSGAYIAAHK
jgi:oligopeptide transport system substrate-binding protein